jgi:hypothetical protein
MPEPACEGVRSPVLQAYLAVGRFVVANLDAAVRHGHKSAVAGALLATLAERLIGVHEHEH